MNPTETQSACKSSLLSTIHWITSFLCALSSITPRIQFSFSLESLFASLSILVYSSFLIWCAWILSILSAFDDISRIVIDPLRHELAVLLAIIWLITLIEVEVSVAIGLLDISATCNSTKFNSRRCSQHRGQK